MTRGGRGPVEIGLSRDITRMQRPLWGSQRLQPNSPLQNMVHLTHIDGAVDADRLAEAFAAVVSGSDVLGSTITEVDGRGRVTLNDRRALTEVTSIARADVLPWASERARHTINLASAPYDSVLIQHEDQTASWYLGLHHAVTDATSSALVFHATANAYHGRPAENSVSYYRWARALEQRDDDRTTAARSHWSARAPAPGLGRLYRAVTRPTPDSTRCSIALDDELLAQMDERLSGDFRSLSDDLAWTTVLITASAAFISRTTGASEFSIGVPVHGRNDSEARSLIGPVMEVFPVDITVDAGDTFRELHRRVGRSILNTLRYALPGSAPGDPDYEVLVNVVPRGAIGRFGEMPTDTTWIHPGASDPSNLLRVQLSPYSPSGLSLHIDVNHAAIDKSHLARISGHFTTVLRCLVKDPDSAVAAVTIPGGDELAVIRKWGKGPEGPTPRRLLPALREAIGSNHDIVLDGPQGTVTGAELWERTLRVAGWLESTGVRRGSRVGLEMGRSNDTITAILSILLSGASYVPLDPSQPAERRKELIDRAACSLVLDSVDRAKGHKPIDAAAVEARVASDEAYVLFTSGSTGVPKGVPISDRGLESYLEFARSSYFGFDDKPIAPLFSALTFDLTVTTLFAPLMQGGKLVVIEAEGALGLAAIAARDDLTWMKATPSHLDILMRLEPRSNGLRTLIVGGESFTARLGTELQLAFPDVRVFNEYGPTEAVVGCMIHQVSDTHSLGNGEVPIGRPAPGVRLRILDAHQRETPIGAVGELYISREGMAHGYLDAESHDADAFITIDDTSFYRSGDMVRLIDDETLVFIGRADDQLKVNGIRLEPMEVQSALEAHPAVARAVVRLWSPEHREVTHRCTRCGLASNVPGVEFDQDGVCDACRSYDEIRAQAGAWFKTPADLQEIRDSARAQRTGDYDCLHMLSGGKDSTYALYKLVDMGFRVFALTLDNGFISDEAKANVRRSVTELGVDHEFVTADVMNEVFRASLDRYSNVCQGCYKTLYTVATNRAVDLGIPVIITGLSRGQLFETRLQPEQFRSTRFDPDAIDAAVIEARKHYHRTNDAVNRLLDTAVFEDDEHFERVRYVDFYRYFDVELAELYRFLEASAPWVRPRDTGRSTNCLINAAGIQTHLTEQGFHNYAVPYAWDVRLGHKTREEAIEELDDDLDDASVDEMLSTVGYAPQERELLTAWIELAPGTSEPSALKMRSFLAERLPAYAVPSAFVFSAELPVTANGKLDVDALSAPVRVQQSSAAMYIEPESALEKRIVGVYKHVLGLDTVGVDDDFFEAGGDSLRALEMIVLLSSSLNRIVGDEVAFTHTTPRRLAEAISVTTETSDAPQKSRPSRRPEGTAPPLSDGEKSLLFEHYSDPTSHWYSVSRAYFVHGAVDQERLLDAVRHTVSRHAPLVWTYGEPRRQLLVDEALVCEVRLEPSTYSQFEADARAMHDEPFDLEAGPLVRLLMGPIDDGSSGIALTFHHVSIDASSFDRLWREVDERYAGVEPAELKFDYADHAAWQHDRERESDAFYWSSPDNCREAADLHLGTPIAGVDSYAERVASFTASELSTAPGATPFATVLAALACTLRRRTEDDTIAISITASTREHPDADPLVGYFLNTLPLLIDVGPSDSLSDVCERSMPVLAGALEHRTYPYASIVAQRRRATLAPPNGSIMLSFEQLEPSSLGGWPAEHRILSSDKAVTDATFFVQVRDNHVDLGVEYRGSVLDEQLADLLLRDFDQVLRTAIDDPAVLTGDLELGSVVGEVTGLDPEFAVDGTVVDRILEQCCRDPDAIAVRFAGKSITYGELDSRSRRLAGRLRSAGAGPGRFVAVESVRHGDVIVAILAILRSGAAYVPIDPDYPQDHIDHIFAEAGIDVLVTVDGTSQMAAGAGTRIFAVEDHTAGGEATDPPAEQVSPENPAYVIYTSGSTGRPKGVVVSHANLAHSTIARTRTYPSSVGRFLLLSSFAFDSSMVGLFWTLHDGGTVVVPEPGEQQDPWVLGRLIENEAITHMLALPSLYQLLVAENEPDLLSTLQTVIVAGEQCQPSVVEAHRLAGLEANLYNEYGPTEATVWSHFHHIDTSQISAVVPIGGAIPGVSSLVVDGSDQPVPTGVPGELLLAGPTVTRGYHGDSEGTDERFVHLYATPGVDPASTWFRTGDIVESRPDGDLLFRGRIDQQVKIRGFRVELGDIEAAALSVDGVSAAFAGVVAPDSGDAGLGQVRLALWFLGDGVVESDDVRDRLRSKLPDHMVPTLYSSIGSVPMTPNGKLDRDALPAPKPVAAVITSDGEPETEEEVALAGVWVDVLDLDQVGLADNFFDVGGDSIVSIQIVARLRKLGYSLTPRDVFTHQTIAELALVMGQRARVDPGRGSDADPNRSVAGHGTLDSKTRFELAGLDDDQLSHLTGLLEKLDSDG